MRFPESIGGWSFETIGGLLAISREIDRQAQMIGYVNAFTLYTVVCFASIPFLLFVRIRKHE